MPKPAGTALNAATLDLAQEAGLFTKEARAEFESEWYIPFFRESDDGDVIASSRRGALPTRNLRIKKLWAGVNTNDLLENISPPPPPLIDASGEEHGGPEDGLEPWRDTGIIEVSPEAKQDGLLQAPANGKRQDQRSLRGGPYDPG